MTTNNDAKHEARIAAYQELCTSYHKIADFRAKLLGLLPLASGTGIYLLASAGQSPYYGAIGSFGFLITLGLYFYEIRGIQRCNALIEIGKHFEKTLGVEGQFILRPKPVRFVNRFRSHSHEADRAKSDEAGWLSEEAARLLSGVSIGTTEAARVIYPAVLGAWAFLTVFSTGMLLLASMTAVIVFLIGFFSSFFLKLDVTYDELKALQRGPADKFED